MCNKCIYSLVLISFIVVVSSCVDTRKSTYFNDLKDGNIVTSMADTIAPVIQKNDILSVVFLSLNADASAIFNLPNSNNGNSNNITNAGNIQPGAGYLVNSEGYIQIPILGNIQVAGFTSKDVKDKITAIVLEKKLLIDPIINVHRLNYEVTIIGEVAKPTVINVPNEKISLLKALGLAGDITVFGRKDNVLLIREVNGKRRVKRLDLNNADFLVSPFYYLQPNDVVYVEANKNKLATNSNALRSTLPIVLTGISIVLLALDRIIK